MSRYTNNHFTLSVAKIIIYIALSKCLQALQRLDIWHHVFYLCSAITKDYISNVDADNPYGATFSRRLPHELVVGRSIGHNKDNERNACNAVDALVSRAAETTVPAAQRTSSEGRRQIIAKKKEILEAWAKATGR